MWRSSSLRFWCSNSSLHSCVFVAHIRCLSGFGNRVLQFQLQDALAPSSNSTFGCWVLFKFVCTKFGEPINQHVACENFGNPWQWTRMVLMGPELEDEKKLGQEEAPGG
jgi:hypothetical protein